MNHAYNAADFYQVENDMPNILVLLSDIMPPSFTISVACHVLSMTATTKVMKRNIDETKSSCVGFVSECRLTGSCIQGIERRYSIKRRSVRSTATSLGSDACQIKQGIFLAFSSSHIRCLILHPPSY